MRFSGENVLTGPVGTKVFQIMEVFLLCFKFVERDFAVINYINFKYAYISGVWKSEDQINFEILCNNK